MTDILNVTVIADYWITCHVKMMSPCSY